MIIFAVLIGGLYSAFQHFSGRERSDLDPKTFISSLISLPEAKKLVNDLLSAKINPVHLAVKQQSPKPAVQGEETENLTLQNLGLEVRR